MVTSIDKMRPNDKRARVAIIMIWVLTACHILSYGSDFLELLMLKAAERGDYVSMESASANDLRQRLIGILVVVVTIASAVTFIQWFRRAYYNLSVLTGSMSESDGWAAGAWFVPILSLFRPYQMMKEMFLTAQSVLQRGIPNFPQRDHMTLVGWWWGLWVSHNIVANISTRLSMNAETIDEFLLRDYISIGLAAFTIPLAILAMRVVEEYNGMESIIANMKHEEGESTGFDKA